MWNETIKKNELLLEVKHWKLPFSQTCSTARRNAFWVVHIITGSVIAPSPSQNTISHLKLLCHLVSCLKLISFWLRGNEMLQKGDEDERTEGEWRGAEEDIEWQQSKVQNKHVGGLVRSTHQLIMCWYVLPWWRAPDPVLCADTHM